MRRSVAQHGSCMVSDADREQAITLRRQDEVDNAYNAVLSVCSRGLASGRFSNDWLRLSARLDCATTLPMLDSDCATLHAWCAPLQLLDLLMFAGRLPETGHVLWPACQQGFEVS